MGILNQISKYACTLLSRHTHTNLKIQKVTLLHTTTYYVAMHSEVGFDNKWSVVGDNTIVDTWMVVIPCCFVYFHVLSCVFWSLYKYFLVVGRQDACYLGVQEFSPMIHTCHDPCASERRSPENCG